MSEAVGEYPGKSITVFYDASRCEHASQCVGALDAVFDPAREPWIDPDAAPVGDLVKAINACPSGALRYRLSAAAAASVISNVVRVTADGPLRIRGQIALYAADGDLISNESEVALCRCGASRHKPFCDGSHAREAFVDRGAVRESRVADALGRSTQGLEIHPRRDGPYIVKGQVRLVSDDGNTCTVREKAALCRCGASANKPYCDGSHKAVDFVAD